MQKARQNDAHYGAFKLKLLALRWAIKEKFKEYLMGSNFRILTDHNPLVRLDTAKSASSGAEMGGTVGKLPV